MAARSRGVRDARLPAYVNGYHARTARSCSIRGTAVPWGIRGEEGRGVGPRDPRADAPPSRRSMPMYTTPALSRVTSDRSLSFSSSILCRRAASDRGDSGRPGFRGLPARGDMDAPGLKTPASPDWGVPRRDIFVQGRAGQQTRQLGRGGEYLVKLLKVGGPLRIEIDRDRDR